MNVYLDTLLKLCASLSALEIKKILQFKISPCDNGPFARCVAVFLIKRHFFGCEADAPLHYTIVSFFSDRETMGPAHTWFAVFCVR